MGTTALSPIRAAAPYSKADAGPIAVSVAMLSETAIVNDDPIVLLVYVPGCDGRFFGHIARR